MNLLERATASEIERYAPDGYTVSVKSGPSSVVVEMTAVSGFVVRSLENIDHVFERTDIVSGWCRQVALRLCHRAAS